MNRETVIQLAREADCAETWGVHAFCFVIEELEAFANAIEAKTLERAAQVCERIDTATFCGERLTPNDCAVVIRALGEKA